MTAALRRACTLRMLHVLLQWRDLGSHASLDNLDALAMEVLNDLLDECDSDGEAYYMSDDDSYVSITDHLITGEDRSDMLTR